MDPTDPDAGSGTPVKSHKELTKTVEIKVFLTIFA
jgi:hypothetical protein